MILEAILVEPSDHKLVSRAQQGDQGAFEALVHRYDRTVMSIAASYTRHEQDTQDIYQEVFLRVYRSLGGFKFRSEFSTWLYRIVVNTCLSHQMRSKSHLHTPIEGDYESHYQESVRSGFSSVAPVSPEQYAQNSEIAHHIEEAMESLSPQQRLVFTLKHFQGYKFREIAEMMECNEGTVKRYHFTATGKLRKRLRHLHR